MMIVRALITGIVIFAAGDAKAVERRYALLVGANHGNAGETPLHFAIDDARRIGEILRMLGGFLPEDVVVLEEPSADRVRDALARLNARIRSEQVPSGSSLLFVFYSGHADALSLHLGGSNLPWEELRNQTAGSSATARLLVVDACRSGQATRVKGTKLTQAFALPPSDTPTPEGFAILSSAAAGESAQESDELQSSFFTHHFIAALRGVADNNEDGRVTLAEAYRYTADRTVASTASTMLGIQHPTYLYDLKGRSDLVITYPGQTDNLGAIKLSVSGQYLIRDDGPQGTLVLEANVGRKGRTVWLKPGRYFIQRRVPERFFEGYISLVTKQPTDVSQIEMRAVEYAQLARKGGGTENAYSISVWGGAETPGISGLSFPWAARIAFAWDTSAVTLDTNLGLMRSGHDGEVLDSSLTAVAFSLGARKVFDIDRVALSAGLRVGGIYFDQRYSGDRIAPPRRRLAPLLDAVVRADIHLPLGLWAGLEAALRVSYLSQKTGLFTSERRAPVQGVLLGGVGKLW